MPRGKLSRVGLFLPGEFGSADRDSKFEICTSIAMKLPLLLLASPILEDREGKLSFVFSFGNSEMNFTACANLQAGLNSSIEPGSA